MDKSLKIKRWSFGGGYSLEKKIIKENNVPEKRIVGRKNQERKMTFRRNVSSVEKLGMEIDVPEERIVGSRKKRLEQTRSGGTYCEINDFYFQPIGLFRLFKNIFFHYCPTKVREKGGDFLRNHPG